MSRLPLSSNFFMCFIAPLTVFVLAGCNRTPATLRDCLAQASGKSSEKAIIAARSTCELAFEVPPAPDAESAAPSQIDAAQDAGREVEMPVGEYFLQRGKRCWQLLIDAAGLTTGEGFRDYALRVDRSTQDGHIRLVADKKDAPSPAVFDVVVAPNGFQMRIFGHPKTEHTAYRSRSDCEVSIAEPVTPTTPAVGEDIHDWDWGVLTTLEPDRDGWTLSKPKLLAPNDRGVATKSPNPPIKAMTLVQQENVLIGFDAAKTKTDIQWVREQCREFLQRPH